MLIGSESYPIILECQICFEEYNIYDKKPLVMDCGHSVCESCLNCILSQRNTNTKKCPFDNKELHRPINQNPVNWAYIDIITSIYYLNIQTKI